MSFSSILVGALSFLSAVQALPTPQVQDAVPDNGTVVHPGGIRQLLVAQNTTLNATTPAGAQFAPQDDSSTYLSISVDNYFDSSNVKCYISGRNDNKQLVFVGPDGQWYWPNTDSASPQPIPDESIAIPLGAKGSSTPITVPGHINSARVWFSDGSLRFFVVATGAGPGLVEPAAVNTQDSNAATNYGFAEFNWDGGLFANIGNVDFIGMPVGMKLSVNDGSGDQQALGLPGNAVSSVCSALQNQANSDGQPWDSECVYKTDGTLIRVIAPALSISQDSSRWSGYFDDYVNQVLSKYSSETLTINTQAGAGQVSCSTNPSDGTTTCNGDNRSYSRPASVDIFGCNSGPFSILADDNDEHRAIVPRLCAAYNRATFLIDGGNVQPSLPASSYYTGAPYNYYSEFVHNIEWNNLGYAFSYDDVTADGQQNQAGVVSSGSPNTLTLLVGGYDQA